MITDQHDEIVAVLFDKKTITDENMIAALIKLNLPVQPISRAMCRMMSKLGLDNKWAEIAGLPTVFRLDWGKYLSHR